MKRNFKKNNSHSKAIVFTKYIPFPLTVPFNKSKYPVKPVLLTLATHKDKDYFKLRYGTTGFPIREQELADLI